MGTFFKNLAGFLSVFLLCWGFHPISSAAQDETLLLGQRLFEGKCARCHGKDGAGNSRMTKYLKVPLHKINLHRKEVVLMSTYQIESMIFSGNHRMPEYRGKLTDAQIQEVAKYVKALSRTGIREKDAPSK